MLLGPSSAVLAGEVARWLRSRIAPYSKSRVFRRPAKTGWVRWGSYSKTVAGWPIGHRLRLLPDTVANCPIRQRVESGRILSAIGRRCLSCPLGVRKTKASTAPCNRGPPVWSACEAGPWFSGSG